MKLQKRDGANHFHCQNQHGQDHDNLGAPEEFPDENGPSEGDSNALSCSEPAFSSPNVPVPQTEEELKEIWAATVIQTVFRAFLVLMLSLSLSANLVTSPSPMQSICKHRIAEMELWIFP